MLVRLGENYHFLFFFFLIVFEIRKVNKIYKTMVILLYERDICRDNALFSYCFLNVGCLFIVSQLLIKSMFQHEFRTDKNGANFYLLNNGRFHGSSGSGIQHSNWLCKPSRRIHRHAWLPSLWRCTASWSTTSTMGTFEHDIWRESSIP